MLMYQKTLFDRYYFIKSFCHLKTLEKTLRKVQFCITIMARKSMKDSYALKSLFQSEVLRHPNITRITFISIYITVDDVNFCDGLECVYVKYKSRASTARELPDEFMGFRLLKHGC